MVQAAATAGNIHSGRSRKPGWARRWMFLCGRGHHCVATASFTSSWDTSSGGFLVVSWPPISPWIFPKEHKKGKGHLWEPAPAQGLNTVRNSVHRLMTQGCSLREGIYGLQTPRFWKDSTLTTYSLDPSRCCPLLWGFCCSFVSCPDGHPHLHSHSNTVIPPSFPSSPTPAPVLTLKFDQVLSPAAAATAPWSKKSRSPVFSPTLTLCGLSSD